MSCRGFLLLATLFVVAPAGALAQPLWVAPERTGGFHVEYLRPDIEGSSAASGAVYVGFRAPLGSHLALVGELPFAHGDFDLGSGATLESTTTLGNPYVGIEVGPRRSTVHFEVGARLPVLENPDAASSVGFWADPIDRPEAFLEDLVAVTARAHVRRFDRSGFGFLLHAGATLWMAPNGAEGEAPVGTAPPEDEVVVSYGARFGWMGTPGGFLAGVTGRANVNDPNVNDSDPSFEERTLTQLGGAGYLRLGRLRPGIQFRFPLDDRLRETVDYTIGVSLAVAVP